MVQLRVDVEAARARAEFDRAAQAVDNLGDQLTDAEIDAVRLEDAMDDTAREARRLRDEVDRLGSSAPQQLRDDLLAAERAAMQARIAFQRADAEVEQLERSLAEARREAERLEREMNDLDADAGRGFRNWQRSLLGMSRSAGQTHGQAFAAGMTDAAVLAPAIAALATLAGAMINGVLLAGVGIGVTGIGVALAAKQSDIVQKAFRERALEPMKKDVAGFALMFEDELVDAAITFGDTWSDISYDVQNLFAKGQEFVEPLVGGLSELVEKVVGGDGLAAAMEAAGPVIEEVGHGLADTGDALDSFFDSLADGGDGAVKGTIALFSMLTAGIRFTGNAIEFLSKGFDLWTDAAQDYAETMEGILGWMPLVGDAWGWASDALGELNGEAEKTSAIVPIAGTAAADVAAGYYKAGDAAGKAAHEAGKLNDELNKFIDQALASSNAAVAYERAIDELAEGVKKNGHETDIGTEKGRKNVEMVNQAVDAAQRKMQADIEAAGGEKATKAAVDAATQAYRAKLGEIERNLYALGFNKAQVDALLASYRNLAAAPSITKSITYRVSATGPAALVNAAQQGSNYSSGIGGRASGGPVTANTPYIVGEKGPELIVPQGNGYVYTAAQTASMMGAGGRQVAARGGGGVMQVQAISSGGNNDWLFQAVNYGIRTGALRLVVVNDEVRVG